MKHNKKMLDMLVLIFLFLILSLYIFRNSFNGFSYVLYSFTIPAIWIILGKVYSPKTAKHINLVIFSMYVFFLYSYTHSIEPILRKESLLSITVIFLLASPVSILLFASNKKYNKYLAIMGIQSILLISTALTISHNTTGHFSKDVVYAMLQSNQSEITSFLYNSIFTINNLVCIAIFIITSIYIFSLKSYNTVNINERSKFLIILFFSTITLQTYSNQAFYGISEISKYYNDYNTEITLIKERVKITKYEAAMKRDAIFQEKKSINEKRKLSVIASNSVEKKLKNGELHILIIGESLAKNNLSSYGYLNNTTPWIKSSKNKIQFSKVYSNHTHTNPTLSMSLTSSNQYNGKKYYTSPSLISELNLAGFTTAWLSNQLKAGKWDNLVSVIADESDYVKFINSNIGKNTSTDNLDGVLVDELKAYLQKLDMSDNNFIVLHMMGSHGNYCHRTAGVEINMNKLPNQYYLQKDNLCYDKSVNYTDSQLKRIHGLVSQKTNFSSMTFISDHGEDVFNKRGHNSGNFTEYMAQIPMLIWLGKNISTSIGQNLKYNKDKLFTNDLLFDSILGITNIKSSSKKNKYNLASRDFIDLGVNAVTLHGKKKIADFPTNISRNNVATNKKLMAHRVNSLGAMNDAYQQGFKRIEVDLYFHQESNEIYMGHGRKALTGGTLKEFLALENGKFEKLWLDFKNIKPNNINSIKSHLNLLDKKFNLKSRTLIESGTESADFSSLSSEGWYTSYYLPTNKILKLIEKDNIDESEQYTSKLVSQLNLQKIKSISFDFRLYPYVQQYLIPNPMIPEHIKLNTWLRLSSADTHFSQKFEGNQNKVVNDPLIDNIIIQFPTRFKI